jgi:hypothetical protein
LGTRDSGMKLQICRSRFSFEPAGMLLLLFIPAVWQDYADRSSPFLEFLWDGCDFSLYLRHHNGLYPRHKLRFRHYVDSGDLYFEVKAKTNQGRTIKKRVRQTAVTSTIEGEAWKLLERTIPSLHGRLQPTLGVAFKRITLVGKRLPERVTLDLNLTYHTSFSVLELGGLAIAEIKRDRRASRSPVIDALREQRHTPGSMSKYCFGVATLFPGVRTNLFKENLKHITTLAA